MEHIGEILRRELPMKNAAGDLPEEVKEKPDCDKCKDAGWVYLNVPVGHELFGRAIRCQCQLEKDKMERLLRMLRYCQLPLGSEGYTFEKYNRKLGSEEAYQAALKYILINMMNDRRDKGEKTYQIVKAKRGNKAVRIEGMQPQFQQRRIHFVRGALSDQTESQLLQWPAGKLVDIIDAWSMHRKVWRSDLYEVPTTPEAGYVEDFETIYKEHKKQKEMDRNHSSQGLGTTVAAGMGMGLTASGKIYY